MLHGAATALAAGCVPLWSKIPTNVQQLCTICRSKPALEFGCTAPGTGPGTKKERDAVLVQMHPGSPLSSRGLWCRHVLPGTCPPDLHGAMSGTHVNAQLSMSMSTLSEHHASIPCSCTAWCTAMSASPSPCTPCAHDGQYASEHLYLCLEPSLTKT